MDLSKERIFKIFGDYEFQNGKLPSRDTMSNLGYSRHMFERVFGNFSNAIIEYQDSKGVKTVKDNKDDYLDIIKQRLSSEELKALVDSTSSDKKVTLVTSRKPEIGHFKALVTGDSHIGHCKFRIDWWNTMIERAVEENVDFMYHTGDILEGMSGRDGHIYELAQIGFEAQFSLAHKLFQQVPFPIKAITGNHDGWYMGKGDIGLNVGKRLAASLDNFIHLGDEEADEIIEGIKVKLWHGRDGSSYAYSYRTQKFVEGLTGGEKPNILLAGHAHKSIFYECRNIQVIETGSTCGQTGFMRHKKMANHAGFWIIEVWTNEKGISRIKPEWTPFFE